MYKPAFTYEQEIECVTSNELLCCRVCMSATSLDNDTQPQKFVPFKF